RRGRLDHRAQGGRGGRRRIPPPHHRPRQGEGLAGVQGRSKAQGADEMRLEARDIRKNYGERMVVKGLSLRVDSGEIVGLLGPNGAGKTTTFYSLAGFVTPEEGAIVI